MTGWFAVLVVILAAANPAVLAGTRPADRPQGGTALPGGSLRLRGVALGLGVVAVLALGADAILEALSVSGPTFRTAAGAVVGIGGAIEVVRRRPTDGGAIDDDLTGGLLSTLMPPLVFAAVTMATDDDWWLTAVALLVTLAAAAGLTSAPPRVRSWARITFGGLAVGAGVLLVSSGIRAV